MLAAVLWLGNISFTVIDNENHVQAIENEGKKFPEPLLNASTLCHFFNYDWLLTTMRTAILELDTLVPMLQCTACKFMLICYDVLEFIQISMSLMVS